jgi:hypothetical protein
VGSGDPNAFGQEIVISGKIQARNQALLRHGVDRFTTARGLARMVLEERAV